MEKRIHYYHRLFTLVLFVLLPIFLWAISDVPQRSCLKEALSLLTIVSFSVLMLQFFMSRINVGMIKHHKFNKVLKWHKVLGYVFVLVLVFHPFFIVIPRYFESGIAPKDAFVQLISSYDNSHVLFGMIAWGLMLVLGLSAVFRRQLPFSYTTWKIVHGVLSALFVLSAVYHIIALGRHSTSVMQIYLLTVAGIAILMLIYNYLFNTNKKRGYE